MFCIIWLPLFIICFWEFISYFVLVLLSNHSVLYMLVYFYSFSLWTVLCLCHVVFYLFNPIQLIAVSYGLCAIYLLQFQSTRLLLVSFPSLALLGYILSCILVVHVLFLVWFSFIGPYENTCTSSSCLGILSSTKLSIFLFYFVFLSSKWQNQRIFELTPWPWPFWVDKHFYVVPKPTYVGPVKWEA